MTSLRSAPWAEKTRFGLVVALIAVTVLWGGASRLDIPGLLLLQPVAVVIAGALLLIPAEIRWSAIRVPLLLFSALALVMAIQLIPLPPELWMALPGHAQFQPFMEAAGSTDVWRPLSMTPDLTLASLIGLVVPAAALIGFASLSEEGTHRLLAILLIAAVLSAVLGLGQLAGGDRSGFYRYAVTNAGAAVGMFSNRNHQAVFLAAIWPMLAIWATRQGIEPQQRGVRRWIFWAGAVALVPMMIVTGSRAGLIVAVFGIAVGGWLFRDGIRRSSTPIELPSWVRRFWPLLVIGGILALVGLAFFLSRAEAIQRLFETRIGEESRLLTLPVLLGITRDFLPFGTGFGSFDPIYRYYEPDALLHASYLNHAHNDVLELVMTGGIPAGAIGLLFMLWVLRRGLNLWRDYAGSTGDRFAILGLTIIGLVFVASIGDYPLRTPFHAMLFVFASGWLAAQSPRRKRPGAG